MALMIFEPVLSKQEKKGQKKKKILKPVTKVKPEQLLGIIYFTFMVNVNKK